MNVTAYVLINTELGCNGIVAGEIKMSKFVTIVSKVSSVYDLIVRIDAETTQDLYRVLKHIRNVEHIKSTITLNTIEEQK